VAAALVAALVVDTITGSGLDVRPLAQ